MRSIVSAYSERIFFLIVLSLLILSGAGLLAQTEKFDPLLLRALEENSGEPVPVVVSLTAVDPIINDVWGVSDPDEIEYYKKRKAAEIQWNLRQMVSGWTATSGGISNLKYFWAANAMMATLDPHLIWEVAQLEEVQQIVFDRPIRLSFQVSPTKPGGAFTYGLRRMGIPELRAQRPELNGEGIVVGILDTGIDAEHPELQGKVVAWRDFIGSQSTPYDDNGHGTHVAGTIAGEGVGGTQLGVAPRVQLVIGKILSGRGGGTLSGILRGMEWIANPDRSSAGRLRPRVVNNSWGGSMSGDLRSDPFVQAVATWVQLEIFPAFAAGNDGPGTGTVGSPGGLPMAFAVGATDENDQVTSFSSRGPVRIIDLDGQSRTLIKPEIAAPGKDVYSAVPGGGYRNLSGTSMATPHLAGVVALVFQANPHLKIKDVMTILTSTAQDRGPEGVDNAYGAGRVDVVRAIEAVHAHAF